jgi:hypothetical protein
VRDMSRCQTPRHVWSGPFDASRAAFGEMASLLQTRPVSDTGHVSKGRVLDADERGDLGLAGKASFGVLRVDELTVADDVELPPSARRRGRLHSSVVQHGRDTRGPRLVAASGGAVEDLDSQAVSVPAAREPKCSSGRSARRPMLAGLVSDRPRVGHGDRSRRSSRRLCPRAPAFGRPISTRNRRSQK